MSSVFDTALAAATPNLLALFGETVSLTPQGGTAKNIEAIVRRETRQVVSMGSSDLDHEVMDVQVKTSFADGSAYTAKEFGEDGNGGDSLSIDNETWYVKRIEGRKGFAGLYDLLLSSKKVSDAAQS